MQTTKEIRKSKRLRDLKLRRNVPLPPLLYMCLDLPLVSTIERPKESTVISVLSKVLFGDEVVSYCSSEEVLRANEVGRLMQCGGRLKNNQTHRRLQPGQNCLYRDLSSYIGS